ncbi:hypothetical protein [Streptomyces sp. C]|uniref:NAD-dependent epimerase/dehydratase family protein n=1 Tax=Streptomyces sp. C TaxID=253839 RepID=UPI0002F8FEAA|nr:hypothetical protein [Streptomyces sp. C]
MIQPGVVHGPWGGQWTTAQLRRPAGDFAQLPAGDDGGVCNAVYVDDLAEAVLLAVDTAAAAGERFLVGHSEELRWGTFFDSVRALRGPGGPAPVTAGEPVADWELELYRSTARADYGKARRVLGFTARTPFAEAAAVTAGWARWAGEAPEAGA